jgi:hypothetical protein
MTRLVLNVVLLAMVIITPLVWTRMNFIVYNEPDNLMEPFTDATTYLAAGERLNAGHDLYRLTAGDRPVLTIPGLYSAPLLSPPPIAVLWRPLAAVDWGMAVWVVACWIALLGTVVYVTLRAGLPGVLLALLLSFAIGEQLAVANVNAFMPALYVLLWRYRDHAPSGSLVGIAAAIKLAPVALVGWLLGSRRWKAIMFAFAGLGVMFAVGALGAGLGSYLDYLGTLSGNRPTQLSVSGQTGIGWASYAVLVLGMIAAAVTGGRWPRASFVLALTASVLGTPALYASGLVSLLALAAPWISTGARLRFTIRRSDLTSSAA